MSVPESSLQPSLIVDHRRKHPCVLCQQRKVKCDRNQPCSNCSKARVECISTSNLPPKKRKKRFSEAELLARLRRYEAHLKNYGADIDAINREEVPIVPKDTTQPKTVTPVAGPRMVFGCRSLSVRRSLKHIENNLWSNVNDEFRDAEKILQGSSEDEMFESPIARTYDDICSDPEDLLFDAKPTGNLSSLHPPPVQIFRLWQTFLDNVNPIVKLFHAPTIQQKVLDACADLDKLSKGMHVLMLGIYTIAITSLTDEECASNFGQEKRMLIKQYQSGARQALLKASFLRTSNMTILQGFVLYLLSSLNSAVDPRALFCLTGIAIRIAQRMGLNFDGTTYGLRPFETEMRRRLWWQIVFLDSRVGEISGSGPSLLQHFWTTHLPFNVNDSDLFPDMKEPPVEHPGITEMLFVLQKCEIAQFLQQTKGAHNYSCQQPDAKSVDELETRIQEKYLKYCDPQVSIHLISTLMARISFSRLRMGKTGPHFFSSSAIAQTSEENDRAFSTSLTMLEYFLSMIGSIHLERFRWHSFKNMPFPAYIYILCALRHRTTGPMIDRAWKLLEDIYQARIRAGFSRWAGKGKGHSALQLALANLTLKAWEAREAVLRILHPTFEVPIFVAKMKQDLENRKTSSSPSTIQSHATPPEQVQGFNQQLGAAFEWVDHSAVDASGRFDQSDIPMLMNNDQSSISWSFWNDCMQVPSSGQAFDGIPLGYYQT